MSQDDSRYYRERDFTRLRRDMAREAVDDERDAKREQEDAEAKARRQAEAEAKAKAEAEAAAAAKAKAELEGTATEGATSTGGEETVQTAAPAQAKVAAVDTGSKPTALGGTVHHPGGTS